MSILVTGGTGFIGANMARLLAERGRKVVVFDVLPPPQKSLLSDVMDNITTAVGSVTDLSRLLRVIKDNGVEGVIHCAAIVAGATNERPLEALEVNIIGYANVLEAARLAGLGRVMNISSSSVMGGPEDMVTPRREEDPCALPLSAIYPVTKLTCEQLAHTYKELYGVDAMVIRARAIFGPGERRYKLTGNPLQTLVSQAVEGRAIRYESGGDTSLDYLYIRDFAEGVLQAYDARNPRYSLYNIASGKNTTVFEICEALRCVFPDLPIKVGPGTWVGVLSQARQVDLTYRSAQSPPLDIKRAEEDFGFRPEWDMERAIRHWVGWLSEGRYGK